MCLYMNLRIASSGSGAWWLAVLHCKLHENEGCMHAYHSYCNYWLEVYIQPYTSKYHAVFIRVKVVIILSFSTSWCMGYFNLVTTVLQLYVYIAMQPIHLYRNVSTWPTLAVDIEPKVTWYLPNSPNVRRISIVRS